VRPQSLVNQQSTSQHDFETPLKQQSIHQQPIQIHKQLESPSKQKLKSPQIAQPNTKSNEINTSITSLEASVSPAIQQTISPHVPLIKKLRRQSATKDTTTGK